MSIVKSFKVGGCDNTAEELWWHCQCEKHNEYYRKLIFENSKQEGEK